MEDGTLNWRRILSLIRDNGEIHQSGLARLLGVEKSTVSRIVRKQLKQKLIMETGIIPAGSKGGRKSILLRLNPEGPCAIGVDIGTEEIRISTIHLDGSVGEKMIFSTPERRTPEEIIPLLVKKLKRAISGFERFPERLQGVGIGCPGMIDSASGVVNSSVNLENWKKYPIVEVLGNQLGVPVLVDNNTRLSTLAEHWFGKGKGTDFLIYINIQTGIGLGVIAGNRLYRGATDQGCNLHTIVEPSGPLCYCGRKGCIEAMAGEKAILAMCSGNSDIRNTFDIYNALQKKDSEVIGYAVETARYLGMAIAHLVDIIDPEKIILNGPMVRISEEFTGAIGSEYKNCCFRDLESPPKIVIADLKENAVSIGAGMIVLSKYFSSGIR